MRRALAALVCCLLWAWPVAAQQETVSGPVVVSIEDYTETAVIRYHVRGKEVRFKGRGRHDRLESGQIIRARGRRQSEKVVVDALLEEVCDPVPEPPPPPPPPAPPPAPPPQPTCAYQTCGAQALLVLSVQWAEQLEPVRMTTLQSYFAPGSVIDRQMRAVSMSLAWWAPTIVGPYKVSVSGASCAVTSLASAALQAAQAAGVPVTAFKRKLFVFPKNYACAWLGLSDIGSLTYGNTQSWLNGLGNVTDASAVTMHELGHALGLRHAHAWECGTSVLTGACSRIEYGNEIDAMGSYRNTATFGAKAREKLGWWVMPEIGPGAYRLLPHLSTDSSGIKGLKIADTLRGPGYAYYLEYRVAHPDESTAPSSSSSAFPSVIVRRTSADGSQEILDLTPNNASTSYDFHNGGLVPGREFRDGSGLVVTVEAMDATGVTVVIAR